MKKLKKKKSLLFKLNLNLKYVYILNIIKLLKFSFFSLKSFKIKLKKKKIKINMKKLKVPNEHITIFSFKKYQIKMTIINTLFFTKLTHSIGFILSILKKRKKFLRRSERNNYYLLFFLKKYLFSVILNSESIFFYTFRYKFLKLIKKIINQKYAIKKKICMVQKKNLNKFRFKKYRSIKKRIRKKLL